VSGTIRVFVNSRGFDLPPGTDVAHAVEAFDPGLEEKLLSGTAYVTDGRGIKVDPSSPLANGAILRVGIRARRGEGAESEAGDADA
jgi:hypothetical protein